MTNDEEIMKYLMGVYPIDLLPRKITKVPAILVVNTDPSHKPGKHWILITVNKDVVYYFDSIGQKPSKALVHFLKSLKLPYKYSRTRLQGHSYTCGKYVTYFAYHFSRGLTIEEILNKLSAKNLNFNDFKVSTFYNVTK